MSTRLDAESFGGWPDEHVEALKKHWGEGLSASQTATAINRAFSDAGYTRSAVLGKVHRLRLGGRARPSAPKRIVYKVARPPVMKVIGERQTFVQAAASPPLVNIDHVRAFRPLPGQEPVRFGAKGCKWPVGGDGADLRCCGAEREGEKPYCATHCAAAYAPTSKTHELVRSLRRWAA